MQKKVIFSVDLKNLSDFSFFPGAEEFRQKYIKREVNYSYFSFDTGKNEWKEAENDLLKSNLQYRKFFELGLQQSEIREYPVFNLTVPVLYNLLDSEEPASINYSEMGGAMLAEDFKSGVLVIDTRIGNAISAINKSIKLINDTSDTKKGKKYQLLKDLPVLELPRTIIAAKAIKENSVEYAGTFYADGWDGRSTLSNEGIDFITNEHFAASWLFEFKNAIYRQNVPNYLISGVLADTIIRTFKQKVQCTPLTLDYI